MFFKPLKNLFWKNSKQFLSTKRILAKYITNDYKFKSTTLSCKKLLSKNVAYQSSSSNSNKRNTEETPIRKLIRAKDIVDLIFVTFIGIGIYFGYKKYKNAKQNEIDLDVKWFDGDINFFKKMFSCNPKDPRYLPEFLVKMLNPIKMFKTRKSDIWIVSFPKSGTTWIQEIVYLIENNCDFSKAKSKSIEERSPFIDFATPGIKHIDKIPTEETRIIKTHLPFDYLPENIDQENKIIYIVRNPKDVAVSYFHFVKMSTQASFDGSFDKFIEMFIDGKVPYGPWWKHVDDYATRKNVFIVHYEDLHEKPYETIKSLAKFLNKDLKEADVEAIVKWCSFESMKENKMVNYEWYKEMGLFKKQGSFFRKGKIGDWLNYFDKDDSLLFDKTIANNLNYKQKFNYGISQEDLEKIYNVKLKEKN